MPNRILKESIRTNKKVNGLTDFQFRVWAYLITYVDDFGRGSAEPDILKGFVFPRRKGITEASIQDALREMACMGLILLYEVDGESYLCFPNWEQHQNRRATASKFPPPDDGCKQLQADASNRMQTQADAPVTRNSILDTRYSSSESVLDARANMQTVEVYAANNLQVLSPGNMEELASFKADLPDDLIRYAIDEACANGAPRWAYVSAILRGYVRDGIKSVGDAKAAKDKRAPTAKGKTNPATQNFAERGYTDKDYCDDFYIDLAAENARMVAEKGKG